MGGFFSQDNPPPLEQAEGGTPPGNVVVQEPTGVDGATSSFFGRGPAIQIQAFEAEAKQAADAAAASAEEADASATAAAGSAQNAFNTASGIETSVASAVAAKDEAQASATLAGQAVTTTQNSAAAAATSAGQAATSATNAQNSASGAASSSTQAASSAQNAATSAGAAASSANNIQTAANTATTKAVEAATSATQAASSATAAAGSATNAASSVTASSTNASNAAASAATASTAATTATTKSAEAATSATNAAGSATAAAGSATGAAGSATTAATKASEAASSATAAAGSAATATTKASEAATSATSASTSASTATTKAAEASTSATNAATSATASGTSATNAATSATASGTSATNASNSATAAAGSANSANIALAATEDARDDAYVYRDDAALAAQSAASARDATLAAFDSFDDRYLGVKTSNPTVDNDGNALVAGALYFNSTAGEMRVYTGTAWAAAYVSGTGVLLIANNLSDVANAATARTNLGLSNVENKSSATIRGEISSSNVTTALGFTPYNASNPSGYITSSALSPYLTSATAASTYQPLDGDLTAIAALAGTTGLIRKTAADTYSLDTATYLTGITSGQVTTALGFTPYNSTNPSGYISGITSTNVTTALGYTPYNATNPAGYITGITSGNVTTALGYTPYNATNPSGYITSSALSPYALLSGAAFTGNVTTAGNVGIGTSSPQALFTISSGSGTKAVWQTTRSFTVNRNFQLAVDEYNEGQFTITPSTAIGGSTYTTPVLAINASGNVGIGTSSPSGKLTIKNPSTSGDQVILNVQAATSTTSVGRVSYNQTDDTMRLFNESNFAGSGLLFGTNNSEKMRLDYSGNVGIGTSSPVSKLSVIQSGAGYGSQATNSGTIQIAAGPASLNAGGGFEFLSSTFASGYGWKISAIDSAGSQLVFGSRQNSATWTESMRITSGGDLLVGTTSSGYSTSGRGVIEVNGSSNSIVSLKSGGNTTGYMYASYPNFYVSNSASGPTIFETGGAERMRLDSSGNVGVGTSSPGAKLEVVGAVKGNGYFIGSTGTGGFSSITTTASVTSGGAVVVRDAASTYNVSGIELYTGGAERMRIDSSGNVGVGTSSPVEKLRVEGNVIVPIGKSFYSYTADYGIGTPDSNGLQVFTNNSDNIRFGHRASGTFTERMRLTTAGNLIINESAQVAYGGNTPKLEVLSASIESTDADGGSLALIGSTNTAGAGGALVLGSLFQTGAWGTFGRVRGAKDNSTSGNYGGGIAFDTRPNLGVLTQRMLIDSSGNVGIGNSSPSEKLHVTGNILASGNVTAYSDERLKDNIATVENALDLVSSMRGVTYTRKDNGEAGVGVVAQEMCEVLPQVVNQNGEYMSVAYGNIVGVLIEAIKELQVEINELKGKTA